PRGRVASLRTQCADRVNDLRVVPRAGFESIVPRRDRSDRTDVHQVSGIQRMDALFLEGRDLAAVSAIDDVDLRIPFDVPHEPDAGRSENAAVTVEQQRGTEVNVAFHTLAIEHTPRELHAALIGAKRVRKILQRALAPLVAHGAVEGMVDEEKFKDAGARRVD